jgi:hypothetical protein
MSEETKELEGQPGAAVPEAGTPPAAEPQPTPTAEAKPGGLQGKPTLNLDELPEFRKWKSAMDKQVAEVRRQAEEERRQREQLEQQVRQAQMRDATPEEQAVYWQGEAARVRAEAEQVRAEQDRERQLKERAIQFLSELDVETDDPDLDWSGGPTPDGLQTLMASAAKLVKARAEASVADKQKTAEEAARTARQQAIQETGASKVSVATGSGASNLQAEYERAVAALRKRGGNVAYDLVQLKRQYRQRGLKLD